MEQLEEGRFSIMVNSVLSIACDTCLGHGYLFFGDANDYSVESCQCQDVNLFDTPEND